MRSSTSALAHARTLITHTPPLSLTHIHTPTHLLFISCCGKKFLSCISGECLAGNTVVWHGGVCFSRRKNSGHDHPSFVCERQSVLTPRGDCVYTPTYFNVTLARAGEFLLSGSPKQTHNGSKDRNRTNIPCLTMFVVFYKHVRSKKIQTRDEK